MEPRWPLRDLSDLPDDWLEALLVLVDDSNTRDPDEHFVASIDAIYRMRDIQRREGRNLHADPRNVRAEKLRREGKPVPVERGQVYDWNGTAFEITRVSVASGWAELRNGEGPAKRHRLPLPEESRLVGWAY